MELSIAAHVRGVCSLTRHPHLYEKVVISHLVLFTFMNMSRRSTEGFYLMAVLQEHRERLTWHASLVGLLMNVASEVPVISFPDFFFLSDGFQIWLPVPAVLTTLLSNTPQVVCKWAEDLTDVHWETGGERWQKGSVMSLMSGLNLAAHVTLRLCFKLHFFMAQICKTSWKQFSEDDRLIYYLSFF